MLDDELVVLDGESPLWEAVRPLLEVALRLEQNDDTYVWHGWRKHSLNAFLQQLPVHCSLVVGVWEDRSLPSEGGQFQDVLVLGCVCEVVAGKIHSLRTFAAIQDPRLPAVHLLEPGYQHALELINVSNNQIAPVAWALFTDKATWDEWLFFEGDIDKGKLLSSFVHQGRCVLMGSQSGLHHE